MDEPTTAALMFIAHRAAEARVHAALRAAGFDDLTAAQTKLAQRLDPNGIRITDLADRARITKQTAERWSTNSSGTATSSGARTPPTPGLGW